MILAGIYDIEANSFVQLYLQDNEIQAKRNFEQTCLDSNSMLSKYPVFELRKTADIDVNTGDVVAAPSLLARNADFIRKESTNA